MNRKYIFLTVSLVSDLNKVRISISKLIKLYDVHKYVIIVPEIEKEEFQNKLSHFKNVEIINENQILNKDEFFNLCDIYLKNKKKIKSIRKSWYYQQFLKLTYIVDNSNFSDHNLVVWDADTTPIKKIEFFNKNNEPVLYGSSYEYHFPYFQTNKILLGSKFKILDYSCITQFTSLNLEDRKDLRKFFLDFNKSHKISNNKFFIANAVLKSISFCNYKTPISRSLFSEYEFIGSFIINKYKRLSSDQKILKFFRNYVDGKISFMQKIILFIFDYKHITYEVKFLNKSQSYKNIFNCILRDLLIQLKLKKTERFFIEIK
tara:strand:- start:515 stop:1468 length:954 start_codon:yes stop_codon:yes gene_type:complete